MKNIFFFVVLVCGGILSAQVNLTSSLTACYPLNGNANEAINALNGTLTAVTPTVDRFSSSGSALEFSGSPYSYVELPNDPALKPLNAISVSAWYRPSYLAALMTPVFTKNTSFSYFTSYALALHYVNGGYKFRGVRQNGMTSDFCTCTTNVQVNTWYHVVFTIDNSQMNIYVNGVLETTLNNTMFAFNYDPTRRIVLGGNNESNYTEPYYGSIDNLRFYSRVINAAEVNALYTQDPACLAGGVPPVAQFTTSSTNVCVGGTVALTDQSSNSPTAWSWTVSGGAAGNSTLSTTIYTFNSPGTYTASLTSANNSGSSANTATQTIVVHANPTVTAAPSKTLYCPGEKVTLTASGASSYTWSNLQSSSIYTTIGVANANITFTVTGTNSVGCMATTTVSYKVTDKCTGLNEIDLSDRISIYPNPNNGSFYVNDDRGGITSLTLTDISGRLILEVPTGKQQEKVLINIENQPKGIYFLKMRTDSGWHVKQIIKQ